MILHTVNKAPTSASTMGECLFSASAGDCILLIEDGVYGATSALSKELRSDLQYFVLQEDMSARGLDDASVSDHWSSVDYSGFVKLTEQADTVCSWF